ncbi:MAG: hypothetical protein AAGC43_18370, partial [Bacteroidota bacterium]
MERMVLEVQGKWCRRGYDKIFKGSVTVPAHDTDLSAISDAEVSKKQEKLIKANLRGYQDMILATIGPSLT